METHNIHKSFRIVTVVLALLAASAASAQSAQRAPTLEAPAALRGSEAARPAPYHLGAYASLDVGILLAMKQGAAIAGGVVWGPFRAGLSYATFLSNASFGGTPEGFSLRANYIVGLNVAYFIAQSSDEGLYVQAMLHLKEQGVTNLATGDSKNLDSIASGFELGYVWKLYRGFYICPRVGALYYFKSPQGSDNEPIQIGDRKYDNSRHKVFDTYFIPTLDIGYSW